MLNDPYSRLYQLRLALLSGASLIVNPRRQVARVVCSEHAGYVIDMDAAQALVETLPAGDPAADRVTIASKRRSMSIREYRRQL
jgi:hypothetical protein